MKPLFLLQSKRKLLYSKSKHSIQKDSQGGYCCGWKSVDLYFGSGADAFLVGGSSRDTAVRGGDWEGRMREKKRGRGWRGGGMDGRGTSATLHFPLLANTSCGFVFLGLFVHIFWLLVVYSHSLNANNITINLCFLVWRAAKMFWQGRVSVPKRMNFRKKNQTAFDPLPSFHKQSLQKWLHICIYIMLAGMRAR